MRIEKERGGKRKAQYEIFQLSERKSPPGHAHAGEQHIHVDQKKMLTIYASKNMLTKKNMHDNILKNYGI